MNKKEKKMANALMRQMATLSVDKQQSEAIAKSLAASSTHPFHIDICSVGFCFDFLVKPDQLPELLQIPSLLENLHRVESFPFGIINPNRLMVSTQLRANRF